MREDKMAMKQNLGGTLKQARSALGLTQRQLSLRLQIKPSYLAHLEKNQRRPSLHLINRLAKVLNLEQAELFLLAHPEAHSLLFRPKRRESSRDSAWRVFVGNKALLSRHNVQPRELTVLARINRLGPIIDSFDFLFILNSIRQAAEPDQ